MPAASGSLVLREKSFFKMLGMMTTILRSSYHCVLLLSTPLSNYTAQKSILWMIASCMMMAGISSSLINTNFELFRAV